MNKTQSKRFKKITITLDTYLAHLEFTKKGADNLLKCPIHKGTTLTFAIHENNTFSCPGCIIKNGSILDFIMKANPRFTIDDALDHLEKIQPSVKVIKMSKKFGELKAELDD